MNIFSDCVFIIEAITWSIALCYGWEK